MVADWGNDTDATLAYIERKMGIVATIPPRRGRILPHDCDYAAYKERNLIKYLIGRRNHFRRVATRSDKYARRHLAFVYLACLLLWLK